MKDIFLQQTFSHEIICQHPIPILLLLVQEDAELVLHFNLKNEKLHVL